MLESVEVDDKVHASKNGPDDEGQSTAARKDRNILAGFKVNRGRSGENKNN